MQDPLPTTALPPIRHLITSLFTQLAQLAQSSSSSSENPSANSTTNPLKNLAEPAKDIILTLHCLFPNELLSALDLLDRGLVTRFVIGAVDNGRELVEPNSISRVGPQDPPREGGEGVGEGQWERQGAGYTSASASARQDGLRETLSFGLRSGESRLEHEDGIRDANSDAQLEAAGYTPAPPDQNEYPPSSPSFRIQSRLQSQFPPQPKAQDPPLPKETPRNHHHPPIHPYTIYYVRSAQPAPRSTSSSSTSRGYGSGYTTAITPTSYEVRLNAWNCSCPAFIFSAFNSSNSSSLGVESGGLEDSRQGEGDEDDDGGIEKGKVGFGGLTRGGGGGGGGEGEVMPAVCKHLLACVLVERCPALFGAFVQEQTVESAEAAGWGAGWGG
ncbi:MAG: hypothetical protein M1827_002127 [Pycnora praestabilis]|nr:MAG: hypothetical protein M1827_002127 [Pycnora praestabilis]